MELLKPLSPVIPVFLLFTTGFIFAQYSAGAVRLWSGRHAAGNFVIRHHQFFQYSLGIYILSGRGNWTEIFRLPLIYATIGGLLFNLGQVSIPEALFQPLSLLGQSTLPLMLVGLGYRLHDFRSLRWGHAVGGAMLRIFGGFAAATIAVHLIGAEGVNRQVVLLYGSLPAAVINFILTEKFGQDPDLAASIVVLSTILSVVTVPMVFWLIL
jgi:predicted permease